MFKFCLCDIIRPKGRGNMKRIAIDLDKTMFTFKSFLYEFLNKFQFMRSDKKVKYKEIDIDSIKPVNPIIKRLHKAFNPACYQTFPLAIETINAFHKTGYEIYFVSNRPNVAPIVSATCAWLRDNNVHCDKLILGCNNKSEFALQNDIDIMIDDLFVNCQSSEEKGVKSILFNANLKNSVDCFKINKKQPNLTILNSWGKIGQYIEGLFEMENQLEPNDLNDLLDEPEEFVPEFIQIADL